MKSIKLCPRCKKAVYPFAAGITGQYRCSKCGYLGPLVLEIEKIHKEKKSKKKKLKKK